ncbi:hypothetical protein DERP_000398, partial [Dermatophagoides pteronyssinus]
FSTNQSYKTIKLHRLFLRYKLFFRIGIKYNILFEWSKIFNNIILTDIGIHLKTDRQLTNYELNIR